MLTSALAFLFATVPHSLVYAGGGIGSGGSGSDTGGSGGSGYAWSTNGWGWYNFSSKSGADPKPADFKSGGPWSKVSKICRDASADRVIAFLVLRQPGHNANTGVVYDYHSIYTTDHFSGYRGGAGGGWLETSDAHKLFNKLPAAGVDTSAYTWGSNVGWFCYDSTPPSATITAEASVSPSSNVVVGTPVTFTNDLKISNVNNTGNDTSDNKITSSGTAALPALPLGGTASWTAEISPARTTTTAKSYTFTPTAVGKYCRRITASGAPGYVVYSPKTADACVTVGNATSSSYSLTSNIAVTPQVVEAGATLNVNNISILNNGPNSSKPITSWSITRTPSTGFSPRNGSGPVLTSGSSYPISGFTDSAPDSPVGTQICYTLSALPGSSATPAVPATATACATIGKSPKTQIWAGDLLVTGTPPTNGNVTTSTSTKSGNTYGSWAEYGIIASGGITGAASGAAFAGPTGYSGATSACDYNKLSFTNTKTGYSACDSSTTMGGYTNATNMPNVEASFPGGSTISTSSDTANNLLSSDDTYIGSRTGDLILGTNILAPGKTVVIKATGTVTINGDQIDNPDNNGAGYTNINQLPQLVIIANKIIINGGVKQVDAWLIATKAADSSIYTCEAQGTSTGVPASICDSKLVVNGPVMTNHLYLYRTAGSGSGANSGDPAEVFNLRADAYLWAISRTSSKSYIQTVYNTELPPRL